MPDNFTGTTGGGGIGSGGYYPADMPRRQNLFARSTSYKRAVSNTSVRRRVALSPASLATEEDLQLSFVNVGGTDGTAVVLCVCMCMCVYSVCMYVCVCVCVCQALAASAVAANACLVLC